MRWGWKTWFNVVRRWGLSGVFLRWRWERNLGRASHLGEDNTACLAWIWKQKPCVPALIPAPLTPGEIIQHRRKEDLLWCSPQIFAPSWNGNHILYDLLPALQNCLWNKPQLEDKCVCIRIWILEILHFQVFPLGAETYLFQSGVLVSLHFVLCLSDSLFLYRWPTILRDLEVGLWRIIFTSLLFFLQKIEKLCTDALGMENQFKGNLIDSESNHHFQKPDWCMRSNCQSDWMPLKSFYFQINFISNWIELMTQNGSRDSTQRRGRSFYR